MIRNIGWARQELQTIVTAFDHGHMTLKVAKSRVWSYLGIDIKARSKNDFIKKLAQVIKENETQTN